MTLTQRIDRAEAAVECEKVMARHCYYHAGGVHREEIEEFWAKNQNITWAHNFGQMPNRENYTVCYADVQEQNARDIYKKLLPIYPEVESVKDKRALIEEAMHLLTSPVIEVAEDGKSAKGLWYTPGVIFSTLNPQQAREGMWIWERYGADFVLEDGEWVYLNLKVCCDMAGLMDAPNWPMNEGPGGPPPGDEEGDGPPPDDRQSVAPEVEGPLHFNLSPTQLPQHRPRIPEPHKSLDDVYLYSTLTGIHEGEGM